MSLNGMLFTTDVHLQLNQIDCTELRALARVAHVEPAGGNGVRWNAGVEFLTLKFRQVRGTFVAAQA